LTQTGDSQRRSFPLVVGIVEVAPGGMVAGGRGARVGRQGCRGRGQPPPWSTALFGRSPCRTWSTTGAAPREHGQGGRGVGEVGAASLTSGAHIFMGREMRGLL
jgi:hypothetical protein